MYCPGLQNNVTFSLYKQHFHMPRQAEMSFQMNYKDLKEKKLAQ